jgi:hypothetical protein
MVAFWCFEKWVFFLLILIKFHALLFCSFDKDLLTRTFMDYDSISRAIINSMLDMSC